MIKNPIDVGIVPGRSMSSDKSVTDPEALLQPIPLGKGPVHGAVVQMVVPDHKQGVGKELPLQAVQEYGGPVKELPKVAIRSHRTLYCLADIEGLIVGLSLGRTDGALGLTEGILLGLSDGFTLGDDVGLDDGLALGLTEGFTLGDDVGLAEGLALGSADGDTLGSADGDTLGEDVGITEGLARYSVV